MESLYEYGSRAGFWRLHRLLTGKDMPITGNGKVVVPFVRPVRLVEGADENTVINCSFWVV